MKYPNRNRTFVPTDDEPLPNGTIVDVSNGRGVEITDRNGLKTLFYSDKDGVPSKFLVVNVAGFIELRLIGGNFKSCGKRTLESLSQKKKPKAKPIRRLWGKGKGKFRTKGRFASAAIRGTWWLTEDYCTNTRIRVREGSVTVVDLVKKKTVILRAPKSYIARKPAR